MTQSETPVTVLYVVGAGRSGSTILDIVLGNHPDIESTGEVGLLTRTGWISQESIRRIDEKRRRLPICACGKRLETSATDTVDEPCPFWSNVRAEWIERANQDDIETYPELQMLFERYRRWPRLLYESRRPSPEFQSYARLTRALFESMRAVSGKPVIVDSSKHPPRALAFAAVPGIDLRLVHLVRDPRSLAASRKKVFQKDIQAGVEWDHTGHPVWTSGARWTRINLESEWVCARLGRERTIRLRHEDFLEDTKGVLAKVGALIKVDLTDVAEAASSGQMMQIGHNIGGNRVRMSGSVQLQADVSDWERSLSVREKRLLWTLSGGLMRRYGYKEKYSTL